ncbi:MAG: HAMP domain-containing sensor histidine kinase, partial [Actinobacteria bacterium]|nr:HAMP domain-containing sensor histidine kinase [Actinomycetota bacterium]
KVPTPGAKELENSYLHPQTHKGSESYRFKSVRLTQGEYVIVAGSLGAINSQYRSDRIRLLLLILLFLLLASLATWAFVQRDIQKIEDLIDSATEISNGNTEIEIVAGEGDSEVDQLSDALNRMVVALRRTAEIEEASSRRMQDFLGDASHELRTTLTVVKGYVELLSGTNLDDIEQRKRAFSRVTSEILRMEFLIKDLLFLAEFGMTPERSQDEVNLSEMLNSHIADFALLNSLRDISLDIEPGVEIEGSAPHLERLLANIFGNITRHTPPEAPVRVTLTKVGKGLEMCIEDGGPGLPEAAYSNGVQSFQRFDKSRSRENGGSGLGMSIIFAIVNEHNGKVVLGKSTLGGLRIHVFFDNLKL